MDLAFFGLRASPFRLTPDPAFLFESAPHRAALTALLDGVLRGRGPIFLTGELGSGKTTLLRVVAERLEACVTVAYLPAWRLDADGILEYLLGTFGLSTALHTSQDRMSALCAFLEKQRQDGRGPVLLIDDAENLTPEALDVILRLAVGRAEAMLTVVLAGQPGSLVQRASALAPPIRESEIGLECRIGRLSPEETRDYIHYRLRIAGAADIWPFTEAAIRRIASYTRGTPRLINIACDHCLVSAHAAGKSRVDVETVQAAIDELEAGYHPGGRSGIHTAPPKGAVWAGRVGVAVLVLALLVTLALSANALGWLGAMLR
jgi:general secretion pathway protein A